MGEIRWEFPGEVKFTGLVCLIVTAMMRSKGDKCHAPNCKVCAALLQINTLDETTLESPSNRYPKVTFDLPSEEKVERQDGSQQNLKLDTSTNLMVTNKSPISILYMEFEDQNIPEGLPGQE